METGGRRIYPPVYLFLTSLLFPRSIHRVRYRAERRTERAYAAEELVAELCAAFLCAEFSIDGDLRHAGYIASWIGLLKADARAFFTACSRAQAAADYLRRLALRDLQSATAS
jgi:antirestriction protein ArdC